jgi:hypothetical protein
MVLMSDGMMDVGNLDQDRRLLDALKIPLPGLSVAATSGFIPLPLQNNSTENCSKEY